MGDLGALQLGSSRLAIAWFRWAREITDRGHIRLVALVPCAVERISSRLQSVVEVRSWKPDTNAQVQDVQLRRDIVERLLVLLAPVVRLEPGLLRAVRLMLPEATDASLETDVWQHQAISSRHCEAATLDWQYAKQHLLPKMRRDELAKDAMELVKQWRYAFCDEPRIWLEEVLRIPPEVRDALVTDADIGNAYAAIRNLLRSMEQSSHTADALALKDYGWRLAKCVPDHLRTDKEIGAVVRQICQIVLPRDRHHLRQGFDPADVHSDQPSSRTFRVIQSGRSLRFQSGPETQVSGSLVAANLRSGNGFVKAGTASDVRDRSAFWKSKTPPSWDRDWGWDRYGAWAEFSIDAESAVEVQDQPAVQTTHAIIQRLRWIPSGTFLMGSPHSEPERFDDEGPQHQVTISQGFWLFHTQVTQQLWQAVVGDNPSRFVDDLRPVEQVDWRECRKLMINLAGLVDGLNVALPTEAQWEYACRAGTEFATYAGEISILGENDAPVLDKIAWYGGNSGVDFDLQHGVDSSSWPEKQHDHQRAGTRRVAQKQPNAWGLYDMLGNVWQWCDDGLRRYGETPVDDPRGPTDKGADRVIRGGGWFSDAGSVRSAYRGALRPGYRDADLGFRCALVPEAEWYVEPVPSKPRRPGRATAEPPDRRSAARRRRESRRCP